MKAMILETYGPDATFAATDREMPMAARGQVLVKVAATSVNTVDTMIRQLGQEQLPLSPDLPAILGMDFAGTVEAVGESVTGFQVGDEVYGCAGGLMALQGALAEYIPADARLIAHKPKSLSMKQAAALPLVGITAYEGLTRAGIAAGQKVLVQGGAGGVGHVAVQLAKHFGADVYATGAGEPQSSIIEGYGATAINFMEEPVAEYVNTYTAGEGFDLVFDSVGGANMLNSFEAAKLNGHVATTVALVELDLSPAHFKGLSLHVVFMLIPMMHDVEREKHGAILTKLAEIVDAGGVIPLLDPSNFTLEQTGAAHAKLESGTAIGKVVISV
ncbi:MAG: zinc-dependent alcohol dehydrogenase family protein [Pseudomonadota bacterium]